MISTRTSFGMVEGEWESGRVGVWECGSVGEWESGRVGEWESGRVGEWESYVSILQKSKINNHQSEIIANGLHMRLG